MAGPREAFGRGVVGWRDTRPEAPSDVQASSSAAGEPEKDPFSSKTSCFPLFHFPFVFNVQTVSLSVPKA